MTKFAYCDTKREDGVYVRYEKVEQYDDLSGNPKLVIPGIPRERLRAFQGNEWHFIGVRAKAIVEVVQAQTAVRYEFLSPGLWGVESDSDEEYLKSVFEDECEILKNDLALIGEHFKPEEGWLASVGVVAWPQKDRESSWLTVRASPAYCVISRHSKVKSMFAPVTVWPLKFKHTDSLTPWRTMP
jgi:hypothetical protein